jgi:hypothetical protein
MSLSPKLNVAQAPDNATILIQDVTGLYNVTTNPFGYGTPNTTLANVSLAKVFIKVPQYENPYEFSFAITASAISAATRIDPLGNSVNILADLPNTLFPLNLELTKEIFFGNTFDTFSDAKITATYEVTDGSTSEVYNTDQVFYFYLSILLCLNDKTDLFLDGKLTSTDFAYYNNLFQGFLLSIFLNSQENSDEYFNLLQNNCKQCH